MLTGQPVFTGATAIEVCVQHVNSEPIAPSQRLGQPVAPLLEALVLRCLAKNPADRPQSAAIFLEELAAAQVPAWPREQAAAWWRQHSNQVARARRARRPDSAVTEGRDTLIVDLLDRTKRARRQ